MDRWLFWRVMFYSPHFLPYTIIPALPVHNLPCGCWDSPWLGSASKGHTGHLCQFIHRDEIWSYRKSLGVLADLWVSCLLFPTPWLCPTHSFFFYKCINSVLPRFFCFGAHRSFSLVFLNLLGHIPLRSLSSVRGPGTSLFSLLFPAPQAILPGQAQMLGLGKSSQGMVTAGWGKLWKMEFACWFSHGWAWSQETCEFIKMSVTIDKGLPGLRNGCHFLSLSFTLETSRE